VRNYDEDVPANTIRAWTIGLIMTTVCSSLNALFLLRYPNISIGPYVVQLISYPIGIAWAKSLPNKEISLFGMKANLNPGPFNVKEHVIIVAMSNAAFGGGAGYFVGALSSSLCLTRHSELVLIFCRHRRNVEEVLPLRY
jgi:hypothetical protein